VLGRAYLSVIVCQIAAGLAAIGALRYLAVYVEPATFGSYALFQSIVSAAGLFLISWPNAGLLRFGREEWTRERHIGSALAARLGLFVASACVAVVLLSVFRRPLGRFIGADPSSWLWVAVAAVALPAGEMAIYASQAVGRTEIYGYSPLITRVGFLVGVLLIPALAPHAGWTYLAGCLIVSSLAAFGFAVATLPRGAWAGIRMSGDQIRQLVLFSWSLPFAGISTYVVNWIDAWVIRNAMGVALVGIYNWAYQVMTIAGLVFAPIAVILTPRVIDARVKRDDDRIGRYVHSILPVAALMALATELLLWSAFWLLPRMAPGRYAAAQPVVLMLFSVLPAQLISYLITPLANAYEGMLPRIVLVGVGIAVVNVAGDLLLVPRIGILGAAIATASAFTIGALLQIVVVRRIGVRFAPIWLYAAPSLSLIPTLGIAPLLLSGDQRWTLAVAATAFNVVTCALVLRYSLAPERLHVNRIPWLMRALTLEDGGAGLG
jgi:O-antigen/teichoic acid export membrane protein